MPVEAAEEDRVQVARGARVGVAEQHMVELVRIFAGDMAERDPREPLGHRLVEPHRNATA